jgi:hypothetical protein
MSPREFEDQVPIQIGMHGQQLKDVARLGQQLPGVLGGVNREDEQQILGSQCRQRS